jgi:hypothetical protein
LPPLPLADPERPKPRRLLRLASRPKPLRSPFRRTLGRSRPAFRGTSRGVKPFEIPFRIEAPPEGLAPLPETVSKAEASSTYPVSVAAGAEALPRFPGSSRGAIPAAFTGSAPLFRPANAPFRPCHGKFREIPPRIRLRLCGRGFVRLPAFSLERQRPWGSDGAFRLGRGLRAWRSVSGPPPFPATSRSCQLYPIRKSRIRLWIMRITGVSLTSISRAGLVLMGRRGWLRIGRFPGVESAPSHVDRHLAKRVAEPDRVLPGLTRLARRGARRPPA